MDADKLKLHPQLREMPKLVRLADRHRDGRLTDDEFKQWQELQQSYVRGGVLLSILDFGHGLFELLDEHFDGSPSKPELSAGWQGLTQMNVLDDYQKYSAARLPHQLRLTLSRGRPVSQLRSSAPSAPPWFLAMDRNKDLRLIRAEFLGSDAAFDKLDADGDKSISTAEASRE